MAIQSLAGGSMPTMTLPKMVRISDGRILFPNALPDPSTATHTLYKNMRWGNDACFGIISVGAAVEWLESGAKVQKSGHERIDRVMNTSGCCVLVLRTQPSPDLPVITRPLH